MATKVNTDFHTSKIDASNSCKELGIKSLFSRHLDRLSVAVCLVFLTITSITPPAYADEFFNRKEKEQFYKWVDDDGLTHYSQTPPPNKQGTDGVTKIKASSSTPSDQQSAMDKLNKNRESLQQQMKERETAATEEADSDIQKQNEEIKRKNCETAKRNVDQLNTGGRIKIKDKEGQLTYLDDEGINKQIALNRKYLDENCK